MLALVVTGFANLSGAHLWQHPLCCTCTFFPVCPYMWRGHCAAVAAYGCRMHRVPTVAGSDAVCVMLPRMSVTCHLGPALVLALLGVLWCCLLVRMHTGRELSCSATALLLCQVEAVGST